MATLVPAMRGRSGEWDAHKDAIRAAFWKAEDLRFEHAAAMRLLNELSPKPPHWARDAVRAAHADLVAAESRLDGLLGEV